MPGIGNNLYPPIIATYMPAFVRTTACRVYFSLSNYNSASEIQNVQVVVSNQNSNLSALSTSLYPAGIKVTSLQVDSTRESDDKYYITIDPSDLQGGIFEINQYYKVQLRFTGIGATRLSGMNQIASWIVNNQKYFSEWSTVCLVKGIQKPDIYLKGFDIDTGEEDVIFTSEVIDFIGQMYYAENANLEKEALKFFRIKIYSVSNESIIYDSGDIYTNTYNPNEISHVLKMALENGVRYRLVLEYTTTNDYFNSKSYTFTILQNTIDILSATVNTEAEEDFGRIKVNIAATITEPFFGNLTIRRTSSESNFTVWEDIHQTTLTDGEVLNYNWYDYTIKSGVWYRYCAQRRNSKGDRGPIVLNRRPVMAIFDDIFLSNNKMQIKIKYDPSISSFQTVIPESRTETLGGKYPIIRRNGNTQYKTFPISGLITAFCDEEGLFLNKENIYGESLITYYQDYNDEHLIDEYKDFIYEREFREKVIEFLYDNSVKLFRSTTEGNVLVKIMDVSFTPNQSLGRMLYSFSATAYEVDECSLEKYEQYGIQVIGTYGSFLKTTFTKIGQMQGIYQGMNQDIFKLLNEKYANLATDKYINKLNRLLWLRLDFNSDPYLLKTQANGEIIPMTAADQANENTMYGYVAYINGNQTLISPRGFYELIDSDTEITSIYFPYSVDVTIDYIAEFDQTEDTSSVYQKMYFFTRVGQYKNIFNVKENAFLQIYQKYLINNVTYHQNLLSLDKMTFEGLPGTVVYIRDSFDNSFFKHVIGETGILEYYDDEAIINGLYFAGMQLYSADDRYPSAIAEYSDKKVEDEVRETEYRTVDSSSIILLSDIKRPIKNGVYTINNKRYIYYRNQWFDFSDENIVQCPVDVTIDYIYELVKGEYKQE